MINRANLRRFFLKSFSQPGYAARVFKQRLAAGFSYCRNDGRSPLPEAVTIFLTHRCNLKCRICGQWGDQGVTREQPAQTVKSHLDIRDLKLLVRELAGFRPNITLFGGEPLLYPGCVELIREIKEKKMHCLMITNASLLDKYADSIIASGLDELNVSLDGGANMHDQIRGEPGLFERIASSLRHFNHTKKRLNRHKPLLNLQCTINRYNYRQLDKMPGVAKDLSANSLTLHNLIHVDPALLKRQEKVDSLLGSSSRAWKGFEFAPGIEAAVLYEQVKKVLSGRYPFAVDYYPNFSYPALKTYYSQSQEVPSGYSGRCLSPWISGYIFPDGQVRPCLNFSYAFGNIKQSSFKEIWNSQSARDYRKTLKSKRMFPVCVRCTELYRY